MDRPRPSDVQRSLENSRARVARARVLLRTRRYVIDADATARVLVDLLPPDPAAEARRERHGIVLLETARARRANRAAP